MIDVEALGLETVLYPVPRAVAGADRRVYGHPKG